MRELYKDITLGENRYRINKMTARNGSWIAMQMMSYVLPTAVQVIAARVDPKGIPFNNQGRTMTEQEFHGVQDHCLKVVTRLYADQAGEFWKPLLHDSGRWNFEDLETDIVTVLTLTVQALAFNLRPFFAEGGLLQLVGSINEMMKTERPQTQIVTGNSSSVQSSPDTGSNTRHGTARIT